MTPQRSISRPRTGGGVVLRLAAEPLPRVRWSGFQPSRSNDIRVVPRSPRTWGLGRIRERSRSRVTAAFRPRSKSTTVPSGRAGQSTLPGSPPGRGLPAGQPTPGKTAAADRRRTPPLRNSAAARSTSEAPNRIVGGTMLPFRGSESIIFEALERSMDMRDPSYVSVS